MTGHPDTGTDGIYRRDQHYLDTRITADGRDGYPVQAGRYRLIAARACPWANRSIIVRRLLGLESALSMGLCAPVHDEQSWTFDLDPDGRDPVLGIRQLREAYLTRDPHYSRGITVPAIIDTTTAAVVTNDVPQITLDLSTEWTAHHRPGAPDLYPQALRTQIDDINATVFDDVNNGVYQAGRANTKTLRHRLPKTVLPPRCLE